MNGGTLVRRGLLAAAVLGGSIGSLVSLAGTAQANDHSTQTICADPTTGAWRGSITFSSIDVQADHPVVVTFGSASETLTNPGPNGTVTLTQDFSSKSDAEQVTWTIVRNGTAERSGSVTFTKPDGCHESVPSTEPPTTAPPSTEAPPTTPVASTAPNTAPPTAPHRTRPAVTALPVTGGHPSPLLWVGLGSLAAGALITWLTRRQPEDLPGR